MRGDFQNSELTSSSGQPDDKSKLWDWSSSSRSSLSLMSRTAEWRDLQQHNHISGVNKNAFIHNVFDTHFTIWMRKVATVVSSPRMSPTVSRGLSAIRSNRNGFQFLITTDPKMREKKWLNKNVDMMIWFRNFGIIKWKLNQVSELWIELKIKVEKLVEMWETYLWRGGRSPAGNRVCRGPRGRVLRRAWRPEWWRSCLSRRRPCCDGGADHPLAPAPQPRSALESTCLKATKSTAFHSSVQQIRSTTPHWMLAANIIYWFVVGLQQLF